VGPGRSCSSSPARRGWVGGATVNQEGGASAEEGGEAWGEEAHVFLGACPFFFFACLVSLLPPLTRRVRAEGSVWEGETPHTHTLASPAQRTEFVPADDTGMKKVDETEKRRSPLSLTANLMLLSHPAAPSRPLHVAAHPRSIRLLEVDECVLTEILEDG